jgi:hypothetical protein
LNGDGQPDFVSVSPTAGSVDVSLNQYAWP